MPTQQPRPGLHVLIARFPCGIDGRSEDALARPVFLSAVCLRKLLDIGGYAASQWHRFLPLDEQSIRLKVVHDGIGELGHVCVVGFEGGHECTQRRHLCCAWRVSEGSDVCTYRGRGMSL